MKHFLSLATVCLMTTSLGFAQEATWEELAPGVFAVLQNPDNRFNDSNSMVVVTDRDAIVVDAQSSPQFVEEVVAGLRERTQQPAEWLINTHWHTDHTFGNSTWLKRAPNLRVLAHQSLTTDITARTQKLIDEQVDNLKQQIPQAEAALADGKGLSGQELNEEQQVAQRAAIDAAAQRVVQLRAAELVPPSVTYRKSMTLHRDSGDIELHHFRGHTRGDTVVWLPRQRILATGDLLDELPFGGHGYPQSWLAALKDLKTLEPRLIVPGHGPVQRNLESLELAIELWSTLIDRLGQSHREGDSLEEARAALQLDDLKGRFCKGDAVAERNWNAFTPASIERVWAELEGELDQG